MKRTPSGFLLRAILAVVFATGVAAADPQPTDYPPVKLRGYGTLFGTFTPRTADGQSASTLKITCDNEAKAKLVLAKYISDLKIFPGVKAVEIPMEGAKPTGYQVEDQGVFLAARDNATVTIYSGPTPDAVGKLAGAAGTRAFAPETSVPMYLDRWDKSGFRFYYAPFAKPKGPDGKPVASFDPNSDLLFAQQSGHLGLTIWHSPLAVDNAEGITNSTWWDWVLKDAQKLQLPVDINDGMDRATWAYNRYQDQITGYQPGFLGGWYGSMDFGEEILSWNAFEAEDQILAEVQQSLRDVNGYDNITSWLEPHEEMGHGIANLLLEYGPVADQGYRKYLQETYGDVAAVSKRWYGDETTLTSWDEVHAPELASFLGWGPDAIDLAGPWRVSYDAPFAPESGATTLDDSTWPEVIAPNHALVRFLPRKPAVFRRHFTVDAGWRSAHAKVWLYVWDLNSVFNSGINPNDRVLVYVNGAYLPETPAKVTETHWVALDVSKELVAGDNLVAVTLPRGMFNYRVYLSPHEPILYPELGAGKNAQWVDFFYWNDWLRVSAVRRGSQMIRQFDPNRGIMLMSPDAYLDGISGVAKAYGGDFHNTGAMAGFWLDSLPSVARGMGLPMSVEPGKWAESVPSMKAFFGRWLTEGANGIDYFGNEGDITWNADLKKCFTDHLPIYTSIGKYHAPTAEVAALYSPQNNELLDFPWYGGLGYGGSNPLHLGSGYSKWNTRAVLRGFYETDGLMESSFDRGDAAKYKVIIDTNTSIIDDKLLAGIEKYVRDGGTFVTYVQTGRHTSVEHDSWPIEKLTGYHVTKLTQDKSWQTGQIRWAPDQQIFSGDWIDKPRADGMSLQKMAADAQDLAYWKDGSVAIGARKLGQGTIIEIGCRFTSWGLPDRIDRDIWDYLHKIYNRTQEYGLPLTENEPLWTPELLATEKLFGQIIDSRGIAPVPAKLDPPSDDALLRHSISNNGLYDVWTVWNQSSTKSASAKVTLAGGLHPAWALNLNTGARIVVTGNQLPVDLTPYESVIYLTPHGDAASAPRQWFDLQRNWWQGTADPGPPLPTFQSKLTVNLTPDWAFRPLTDAESDVTAFVDPKFDDSKWVRMRFGIFTIPDYPDARHAIFRKSFTVPADWNHGRVALWVRAWDQTTFLGTGHIYLDGKLIGEGGLEGSTVDGALQAGTTHVLAIDIAGKDVLLGARGPVWIAYHPDPSDRQDLAGEWEESSDGLHFNPPSPLPGPSSLANRRVVKIDNAESSSTAVLHAVNSKGSLFGVIVNGRFVTRFHHNIGPEINLNITPWVKFGQENELILMGNNGATIKEVSLEFHDKGTYP